MKTIGIIGAMEEEITGIKDIIVIVTAKIVAGLEFFIGKYQNNSVVLVRSGIGKVNAAICAQILIDHFGVDYVINVGVAGAVYHELSVGDIVISEDTVQHDMDTSIFGDPIGIIPRMEESYFKADENLVRMAVEAAKELSDEIHVFKGRIASGDQFISSAEGKAKIWKNVQGYCAEMEGAAIAQVCYLNQIPFVIIRSISDNAEAQADIAYEKFVPLAAENSSRVVEAMLRAM